MKIEDSNEKAETKEVSGSEYNSKEVSKLMKGNSQMNQAEQNEVNQAEVKEPINTEGTKTMNTNIEEIVQELTKKAFGHWEQEAEAMNEYVLNAHNLGKSNKNIYMDLSNALQISEAKVRNIIACYRLRLHVSKFGQIPQLDLEFWIQVLPLTVPHFKKLGALVYCQKNNLTVKEFRKYLGTNFEPLPRKAKNIRKYLLKFRELLPDIDIKDKIKKSEELRKLLGYLVSQSIVSKLVNMEDIEDQVKTLNQPKVA